MAKRRKKEDIEFVLDYSGELTEADLDFLANLFARVILRRVRRQQLLSGDGIVDSELPQKDSPEPSA